MAVQRAWEAIRGGTAEFALAGGADSYLEPETLEWLESNDQVHSAGRANNAWGFVPGEAAGFVLLASADAAARYRLSAALEVLTAATAKESKLIKTDAVCTGEGLTALFRALAGVPPVVRADHLYCDMNGEPYRADEFGFATTRAGRLFRDSSAFTAPADCWGDVGAASGPLFLVLADAATRKGYAPGAVLAAFTSSESGERCGFVARARPAG
jgi:3-oxoacyl-[acyl-carrier-protein] synthase-1